MPYLLRTYEVNNSQFNMIVTRRKISKSIILRFNQSKSELHISAPSSTKKADIEKFVRAQQAKIEEFLQRNIIQKIALNEGDIIAILGVNHRLIRPQNAGKHNIGKVSDVSMPDFIVKCDGKPFNLAASIQLQRVMQHYSSQKMQQIMLLPPFDRLHITPHVSIRKTHSRYGSCCAQTARIMLCANLVFAPISVLDSVIFHEAAHLIHANHSAEFWALVAQLNPSYNSSKMWLKNHRSEIFCYEL